MDRGVWKESKQGVGWKKKKKKKKKNSSIMDKTDKMEDWLMLRVGRTWVARRWTRKEKGNDEGQEWNVQGESRADMGHGDIRQMAQSARLCLHYSHWSSKKKKKKTAMRQKQSLQVNASCTPPEHVFSLHTQPASATGSMHLLRFTRLANHTPCVWAHTLKLIACFSQEGKG